LGFKKSLTYDVFIDGKPYPPKAVSALAYELATKKKLAPADFAGAKDGYWHKILKQWFPVHPKGSTAALEAKADELVDVPLDELGRKAKEDASDHPEQVLVTSVAYRRSPYVRAAALRSANGICCDCKQPAPFVKRSNGQPYLELHHVRPLARGGADSLENTVALCPNCHARRHDALGIAREEE
jgi:predicted HNH restriction endonuclease